MANNFNTLFGGHLEWHTDPNDKPKFGRRVLAAISFDDMSGYYVSWKTALTLGGRFGLGSPAVFAWAYFDQSVTDSLFESFLEEEEEDFRANRIAELEKELKRLKGE